MVSAWMKIKRERDDFFFLNCMCVALSSSFIPLWFFGYLFISVSSTLFSFYLRCSLFFFFLNEAQYTWNVKIFPPMIIFDLLGIDKVTCTQSLLYSIEQTHSSNATLHMANTHLYHKNACVYTIVSNKN